MGSVEMIREEKDAKIPLYRKISDEIRRDILSGIYLPGEVLPSIREEAKILGVARNTVDAAYQTLAEEGYIRGKRGVGYKVLDFRQSFNFDLDKTETSRDPSAGFKDVSDIGNLPYNFLGNCGKIELSGIRYWKRFTSILYKELEETSGTSEFQVKREIRRYLKKHRGVVCSEEQIYLYRNLHQAVQMIRRIQPHVIYTVPHHEGAMGNHISRKEELILRQRLQENDICMIEDDIDSDLVYGKRPYPTLFGGDTDDRVILTGSFERLFGSFLPIQYVVFPLGMAEKSRRMSVMPGCGSCHSLLELASMKSIMSSESWESFLRKTNHKYWEKRDLLIGRIRQKIGEETVLYRTESGPEIIAEVPMASDVPSFIERAEKAGVGLSARASQDPHSSQMLMYITLNYSAIPYGKIGEGIDLLAEVLGSGQ